METVTDQEHRVYGNVRVTRGRFTASGTEVDVPTGLTKVLWFTLQGVSTNNNSVQVARNSLTTTDMGVTPGVCHCESVGSGAVYEFLAEGL